MTLKGVDIAWSRPTTAQIKAVGAHFVARYLSPDSSKNITSTEVKDYKANGLGVVVVWESSAKRMLGGHAAGVADAKAAEIQRAAVGLPGDTPIYFACDFDAQGSQYHTINEYLRGVASVIGLNRVGIYGGYYVVESVFSSPATAKYGWQTIAWSGGKWSSHAHIRQTGGTTLSGGADWDIAETADYGQYPRPQAPKPTTNGDTVTPAEIKTIADAVYDRLMNTDGELPAPTDDPNYETNKFWTLKSWLQSTLFHARSADKRLTALETKIEAIAKKVGL